MVAKKNSLPRGKGRPFPKGQSGHPTGRPKGVPNKATREAKEFCRALVEDPIYFKNFHKAWQERTLVPQLEQMVWGYAYGRPVQSLDITADVLEKAMKQDIEGTRE